MKKTSLILFLLISTLGFSKFVPEVPSAHCTDNVGVLQQSTIDSLNIKLQQLQQETGTHFLVYVDDSLYGENLEEYVNKLFNTWELGDKEKNNGVLFAVFVKDRAFRIAVGYGLEGLLPDLKLNNLQNDLLIPNLKAGNFDAGINKMAFAIINQLNGEEAKAYKTAFRLHINDPYNILSEETKNEIFSKEIETMFGLDNESLYNYFHIQKTGTGEELNTAISDQWNEILKAYPEKKYKILYAYSTINKCYAIRLSDNLIPWVNQPLFGSTQVFKNDSYLQMNIAESNYRYVFAGIKFLFFLDIEKNSYISSHPIIYYLSFPFFDEYYILNARPYVLFLWDLFLYSTLFFTLANLFILTFLYKEDRSSRKAFFGWTVLNFLFPLIGLILKISLFYRLLKILRKKGNYLKYLSNARQLGAFGNLKEMGKGGGSSYSGSTYSSSGSSSYSRSSYSSSSSSSSYSGYSGGGGGRTGGGGSSGRW